MNRTRVNRFESLDHFRFLRNSEKAKQTHRIQFRVRPIDLITETSHKNDWN